MIEAMICGALPITCTDNETAKEFLPKDFICEPNTESIVNQIKIYDKKQKYNWNSWFGLRRAALSFRV